MENVNQQCHNDLMYYHVLYDKWHVKSATSFDVLWIYFRVLTGKRQYGEIVMPLQGLIEVMKHFVDYTDIPQIKKLADEVRYEPVQILK